MVNNTDKPDLELRVESNCNEMFSLHFSSTTDDERVIKETGVSVLTLDANEIQVLHNANSDI